MDSQQLTPSVIKEELDRYVIGQDEAKKAVAIALRNRWRRLNIKDESLRDDIIPKNILMIGPTGCGKTEIGRKLAKLTQSCLLYTSPSPRDMRRSRMPSSA